VRIPLDYYQILGVPETNLSELEQAYQDRLHQLPRQGYSDAAIESRKQLISFAYQVLNDPEQRAGYESAQTPQTSTGSARTIAASNAAPSSFRQSPDLEIAPEHFLGGLLILFEQGKYEEINSICMSYIGNNGRTSNSGSLHPLAAVEANISSIAPSISKIARLVSGGNIMPLKPDIVLTMVFSLLEMGEQEWKQAEYEVAGSHLDAARKILIQEDLFPHIQGQIERRLGRLRPYRISYLVSLPLDRNEQRLQGIQFLEELLEIACKSELECQERFGLNGERTVQFVHETLPHLTAGEQSNLFSHVAQDSHQLESTALNVMQLACIYLHAHALTAQGFAYRNPQLIYRAQQIFIHRLGLRLNVTIEQAICALLLGQVDLADRLLNSISESAALVVIRQQSQGYPNLIRGLCWYVESWLKTEVFPCFRDLSTNDPTLATYFNNPDVQNFADRLSVDDRQIGNWATSIPKLIDVPISGDLSEPEQLEQPIARDVNSRTSSSSRPTLDPPIDPLTIAALRASLSTAWQPPQEPVGSNNLPTAERVPKVTSLPPIPVVAATLEEPTEETSDKVIQLERERRRRRPTVPQIRTIDGQIEPNYLEPKSNVMTGYPTTGIQLPTTSQLVPTGKSGRMTTANTPTATLARRRRRRSPNIPRLLLVMTGGLGCLWGSIWLGSTLMRQTRSTADVTLPAPTAPVTEPVKPVVAPPAQIEIASVPKEPPIIAGLLSAETATKIVQTWLGAKAKSLGKEYQIAELKDILVEPALSRAIERTKSDRADGVYWKYKHTAAVLSMPPIDAKTQVVKIQAQVQENAECYTNGVFKPERSYSKKLSVEYNLVRQQDRWYVKDMQVVR
jgi:hypothetical protein